MGIVIKMTVPVNKVIAPKKVTVTFWRPRS